MFPLKDDVQSLTTPFVTIGLILLNVLLFLYELALQGSASTEGARATHDLILEFGLVPCRLSGACDAALSVLPPALTIVTSMFLHGGLLHLGGNMLYLWIFGDNVEDTLGHGRFLVFFLVSGVIAAVAQVALSASSSVPMIGASGAVSGVLGAYLLLFPRANVLTLVIVGFFVRLIRIPAVLVLGFWFLIQFVSGLVTWTARTNGGEVAWFAHLGGFLAGGFGTRLRPLTAHLPKPLVPVGNVPIMEHIVRLLKRHGFTDLAVLLYFLPDTITGHFGDGSAWGVNMTYVTPTADLGTAGAVKFAVGESDESVLVVSADVLTDFDLAEAVAFHRSKDAEATMVLTRVEQPLAYGIVITDEAGRVLRFLEKPAWGEVFSDTINTGIYLLEPSVFRAIPGGRPYDFGKELFPALLASGRSLWGHVAKGYWRDVGDLAEYRTAHLDLLQGRVGVDIPGERHSGNGHTVWLDAGARVDYSSRLAGSVIVGRGALIAPGARVANSVIGPDSIIQAGADVEGSVIWDGVEIGPGAVAKEAVIGRKTMVGANAFLSEGVVIADFCRIGEASVVKANVKVWPYKEVEDGATLAMSLVWGERWSRSLFGRYGVSGLANIEVSPEFAAKLGAACGAIVGRRRVMITSRDHHKASRMINRALMSGLLSVGVDVQDLGVAPIPVVRYQISALGLAGGTHVRKSPYDPQILDIKFLDSRGLEVAPDREKAMERLFFMEDFERASMDGIGTLSFPHAGTDRYRDG